MPEMDGYEAIRCIRSLAAHDRTPIVVLTGFSEEVARDRLRAAKVTGFLRKPIRMEELRGAIAKAAERKFNDAGV